MRSWEQIGMLDQSLYKKREVSKMAAPPVNEMDDVKPRRFYSEVRISRWMGILPYSNNLEFSNGWSLYSYVIATTVCTMDMAQIMIGLMNTEPIAAIDMMEILVRIIRMGVLVTQCVTCRRIKDFKDLMRVITDPDGENIVRPTTSILTCLTLTACFTPFTQKNWITGKQANYDVLKTILKGTAILLRCYNEFSNLVVLRQFCIVVDILGFKISRLTKQIKSPSCSPEMVDKLCEMNDQCMARAKRVNDIYSLQILLMTVYILIKMLNLMYESIISVTSDEKEDPLTRRPKRFRFGKPATSKPKQNSYLKDSKCWGSEIRSSASLVNNVYSKYV